MWLAGARRVARRRPTAAPPRTRPQGRRLAAGGGERPRPPPSRGQRPRDCPTPLRLSLGCRTVQPGDKRRAKVGEGDRQRGAQVAAQEVEEGSWRGRGGCLRLGAAAGWVSTWAGWEWSRVPWRRDVPCHGSADLGSLSSQHGKRRSLGKVCECWSEIFGRTTDILYLRRDQWMARSANQAVTFCVGQW